MHAAREDQSGTGCFNYCVSSYTPTLTALLSARHNLLPGPLSEATALLAVAPSSPHGPQLESAVEEVETVAGILASVKKVVLGADASRGGAQIREVLSELSQASIVHIICHGEQDRTEPLNSGFFLSDGRLTLAMLMRIRANNGQFAFLSACETAKGDGNQPDQAVHLAAAFLFAGFRSVIATMG